MKSLMLKMTNNDIFAAKVLFVFPQKLDNCDMCLPRLFTV